MNEDKEVDFSHFYDKKQTTPTASNLGGESSSISDEKINIMKIYKSKYTKIGIIIVMVLASIFILLSNKFKSSTSTVVPGTFPPNDSLPKGVPKLPIGNP